PLPLGRAGPAHDPRQTRWTKLAGLTQRHDPSFQTRRGLMRARPRSTRPILEPRRSFVAIATPPLVRALTRDVHRLGRCRDRPTILNPQTKPEPTFRRGGSVTVHRSSWGRRGSSTAHHSL